MLHFSYQKSCGVSEDYLKKEGKAFHALHKKLHDLVRHEQYDEPLSCVRLAYDTEYQNLVQRCVVEKKALDPALILLIGIGGSSLGAYAVYEALRGPYYNEIRKDMLFYCADTLDSNKNDQIKRIVEKVLRAGRTVLYVIISKSGSTLETIENSNYFISLLQEYHPLRYHNFLVFITDKNSTLWNQAHAIGSSCLPIPKEVGGRFSVFSAVGMFPLGMLGVDCAQLCEGARETLEKIFTDEQPYPCISALILWHLYKAGKSVHDTFIFDQASAALGLWYRQLMAESLGKDGKGLLPTVSVGTTDLHSMIQFYFGGPRMNVTTFVQMSDCQSTGASQKISDVIFEGVKNSYQQAGLPYVSISLMRNEKSLGAFLQFKMLEIFYLGWLMDVPVFGQPQVELYKQEVKKLLREA